MAIKQWACNTFCDSGHPFIIWISLIGEKNHIPHFVFLRNVTWKGLHFTKVIMFAIPKYLLQFTMKHKIGMINDVSRNFALRQNESKIQYIICQNLLNIVCLKQTQLSNDNKFYRKIHNNAHITHQDVFISLKKYIWFGIDSSFGKKTRM